MRFGENFIDELKTRLRPSEVIGRHVKLKRQGREFAGLSPFNNEKTPSFFVNDEKGFYHCFSSGKHGDIISFLMETQGLSFTEAIEQLALMAGMDLPKEDPRAEERAKRHKTSVSWMEQAQMFYARTLMGEAGKAARQYLKSRGLGRDDCERFGIGFAPDSFSALKDDMIQRGASSDLLVEAGLLIKPDDTSRAPWDRFRNRIMFPIHDGRGRIIAFGGRAMDKDAKAKYLNSPETPLFHKGSTLYNYAQARKALSDPKNAARGLIVAEGYMDVIALSRAGFAHAVAPLGTALTEDQLALLWRVGSEPILCFDGDKAGIRAAYRSVERAIPLLRPGHTLRFALLPEGFDPDDLIRVQGRPAMQSVLERSIPMVDMVWEGEVRAGPLDTPEARAGLKNRLFTVLRQFSDEGVREQYKAALLERFDKQFGRAHAGSGRKNRPFYIKNTPSMSQKQAMGEDAMYMVTEYRLMGAILEWPEMLEILDQAFFDVQFRSDVCQRLQSLILNWLMTTKAVDKSLLYSHIQAEGMEGALKRFRRERSITRAAMGGEEASLETRTALWIQKAARLIRQDQSDPIGDDTQSRMAEAMREENEEALKRLLRADRRSR